MQATQNLGNYFSSLREKRQDTEFMPEVEGAILEDSPWLSRATIWVVSACLLAALVWANFAVLEEVTTGEGKAIPSSKVQVIQNLEGGIVSEIFVREGQVVDKGDTCCAWMTPAFSPIAGRPKRIGWRSSPVSND